MYYLRFQFQYYYNLKKKKCREGKSQETPIWLCRLNIGMVYTLRILLKMRQKCNCWQKHSYACATLDFLKWRKFLSHFHWEYSLPPGGDSFDGPSQRPRTDRDCACVRKPSLSGDFDPEKTQIIRVSSRDQTANS